MPKRILAVAFAAGVLALGACNSNNVNNLYGAATPTPGPVASVTPNPSLTSAAVTVTYQGSPLPNQPVSVSTPDATGHAGTAFLTQNTNATGLTTFTNLTGAANYCFSTSYPIPGTSPQVTASASYCTTFWGGGVSLKM